MGATTAAFAGALSGRTAAGSGVIIVGTVATLPRALGAVSPMTPALAAIDAVDAGPWLTFANAAPVTTTATAAHAAIAARIGNRRALGGAGSALAVLRNDGI